MGSTLRGTTGLAWWLAGVAAVAACAQGSTLDPDAGLGGAGGAGAGPGATSTSGTASTGSSSSGSASTSTSSSSAGSTSSSGASSSGGASSSASSSSSGGCGFQQHLCGGMCVGNTADTGCFLSAACTPCPVPANGIAICTAQGTCSVMCNPGYVPNATNTDCDPIPPPMECCDDNECPIFTICLGGYCQSPFGGMCDPAKCTEFCQCAVGGSPQSVGMCVLDVIFWTCECSP